MVHTILFNRKSKKGEDGKLTESLLAYFSEDVKQFYGGIPVKRAFGIGS